MLSTHPLYSSETLVRDLTQWHLVQEHSVFQLFQIGDSEQEHAETLLQLVAPPRGARVLSLGSGVGGMERFWQLARPDLRFTLVNQSQAQLSLSLCEGTHICQDAAEFQSDETFDVVIVAYVLGHVDAAALLARAEKALAKTGLLLVYDVFEGSPKFDETLLYDSPSRSQVEAFAVAVDLRFEFVLTRGFKAPEHVRAVVPRGVLEEVQPALFLLRKL